MKKKKLLFSSSPFYFDDCPICQAMKKAKEEGRGLSLKELREAFRRAKKKGAIVGGNLKVSQPLLELVNMTHQRGVLIGQDENSEE